MKVTKIRLSPLYGFLKPFVTLGWNARLCRRGVGVGADGWSLQAVPGLGRLPHPAEPEEEVDGDEVRCQHRRAHPDQGFRVLGSAPRADGMATGPGAPRAATAFQNSLAISSLYFLFRRFEDLNGIQSDPALFLSGALSF